MCILRETNRYASWFDSLRDRRAKAHIVTRLKRLQDGNPGNSKSVGAGVVELKIDYGPGYRVYFTKRGTELTVILAGGDKNSQSNDIAIAKQLRALGRRIGMSLETTEWKVTDHLQNPEDIFYYLEAELEESEAPYAAQALNHVIEVRGGIEKLSCETGVSREVLERSRRDESMVDRDTLIKVMEAFRPASEMPSARVA